MRPSLFSANAARDVTREVIFKGVPINGRDREGDTALHAALRRRASLEVVVELVRLGAELNSVGGHYQTPMILAVFHPDLRVSDHLLDSGALVNGLPRHLGPLHAAVFNDNRRQVDLLLARGADPNHPGQRGATPLFVARSRGMVQRLLSAGADPYQTDEAGRTAINRWGENGIVEALDALHSRNSTRPRLAFVGADSG